MTKDIGGARTRSVGRGREAVQPRGPRHEGILRGGGALRYRAAPPYRRSLAGWSV